MTEALTTTVTVLLLRFEPALLSPDAAANGDNNDGTDGRAPAKEESTCDATGDDDRAKALASFRCPTTQKSETQTSRPPRSASKSKTRKVYGQSTTQEYAN